MEADDVLAMQLSTLHRQKNELQKELETVVRERDHLSQCMQLLHSDNPALFEVRRDHLSRKLQRGCP